jgi:hypothetical protein
MARINPKLAKNSLRRILILPIPRKKQRAPSRALFLYVYIQLLAITPRHQSFHEA